MSAAKTTNKQSSGVFKGFHHEEFVRELNKALAEYLNYKPKLSDSDVKELEAALSKDSYSVDRGSHKGETITEDSVNKKIIEHFKVEPGISEKFVKEAFSSLDDKATTLLKKMKESNKKLIKEFNDSKSRGDEVQTGELGEKISTATIEMLNFLVEHNVPCVFEVCSEIAVQNDIKTYSGGLGVLAGDKHKQATDMDIPLITFAILPEHGYGDQMVNVANRAQIPVPARWKTIEHEQITLLRDDGGKTIEIDIPTSGGFGGPTKALIAIHGHVSEVSGMINPVIYFTTFHSNQTAHKRYVTEELYPSHEKKLVSQYGLAYLSIYMKEEFQLKHTHINLNEGHAALTPVIMMRMYLEEKGVDLTDESRIDQIVRDNKSLFREAFDWTRNQITFVTHTIARAAFDSYDVQLMRSILDPRDLNLIFCLCNKDFPLHQGEEFRGFGEIHMGTWGISMADMAIFFACRANAVAKLHQKVTNEQIFPKESHKMENVTNSIHERTWNGKSIELREVFSKYTGNTEVDYMSGVKFMMLKKVKAFREAVYRYHLAEKAETVDYINRLIKLQHGVSDFLSEPNLEKTLTVVHARRMKEYKQNSSIVLPQAIDAYRKIGERLKDDERVVFVVSGKPHPNDQEAKDMLNEILLRQTEIRERSRGKIRFVFKENYDMDDGEMFAKFDMNIATPVKGFEASGTSPMKNPLRLVMHTDDGFMYEYMRIAESVYGVSDASFLFGPSKIVPKEEYDSFDRRVELMHAYSGEFGQSFEGVTDMFFNNRELWIDKMIEQLAIFTTAFGMRRFVENYLTIWQEVPHLQEVLKL